VVHGVACSTCDFVQSVSTITILFDQKQSKAHGLRNCGEHLLCAGQVGEGFAIIV
jgi:hypothetical protein